MSSSSKLVDGELGLMEISPVFAGNAALWFYVLKESEKLGAGGLGPVGGRIVAEVLLGLLKGDPLSYVQRRTQLGADAQRPGLRHA